MTILISFEHCVMEILHLEHYGAGRIISSKYLWVSYWIVHSADWLKKLYCISLGEMQWLIFFWFRLELLLLAEHKQTKYLAILCLICNLDNIDLLNYCIRNIYNEPALCVYVSVFSYTNLSSSPSSQMKEGIGIGSFVLQVCFPSTWADSIPLRALWQNVLPKKLLNAAWLSLLSAAWHHTIEKIWHVQIWGQQGEDLAGKWTAPAPVSLLSEETTKDWLHR